jgi:hypothetical protein|eukprot:SAG25_NODE_538_length_7095_cov_40.279588_4_plen_146_part_00
MAMGWKRRISRQVSDVIHHRSLALEADFELLQGAESRSASRDYRWDYWSQRCWERRRCRSRSLDINDITLYTLAGVPPPFALSTASYIALMYLYCISSAIGHLRYQSKVVRRHWAAFYFLGTTGCADENSVPRRAGRSCASAWRS